MSLYRIDSLILLILFAITINSCGSDEPEETEIAVTVKTDETGDDFDAAEKEVETPPSALDISTLDPIATPKGFRRVKSADGDLDKDGTPERVVIYETGRTLDMGKERELRVYRASPEGWELWHSSIGSVLPSEGGGAMGEPLRSVAVERGAIVLHHSGGSRAKWDYVHRYRFQEGAFHLIGTTTESIIDCDVRETFDYNLMTGKADVTVVDTECDESGKEGNKVLLDERIERKLERLPKMDGFVPGETRVESGEKVFVY